MTYGAVFIAGLFAFVITIMAIGSKPASDFESAASSPWPQVEATKTDRIITGSVPAR